MLVGEPTYRATDRAIEYADADSVTAKGKQAPLEAWLAVAYNIGPSGILGFYLWNRALTLLPAGAAAVGSLAVPVVGVLSGAAVLGEAIGWREIAALLLVAAAIAVVMGGLPGARTART